MSATRTFSKISPAVWRSGRFRNLTDTGKIGYLYLVTNGHVTSAGVYELPEGYACSDLDWSPGEYQSVLRELVDALLIDIDRDVVLIERWFKHNPPMNDDHAAGTRRYLAKIESDRLREKALASFDEHNTERIEREAAKAAEKQAKANGRARSVAETIGNTSRLASTRFVAGNHG